MHRSPINAFSSPKTWHRQITELREYGPSSGPEIGALIAAVPSKGHDSPRAECAIARRTKSLGTGLKWLVACSVRGEFNSVCKRVGLVR